MTLPFASTQVISSICLKAAWIAFCALLASGSQSVLAQESVGLVFDETRVSLGRVEVSGDLEHVFPFRVVGKDPVQILDVRPSCGCLHPHLSKRLYYPGEKDELTLRVHATSQQAGLRRFQVTLSVRQGTQTGTVPLVLEFDLFKPIVVSPSNLLLFVNGSGPIHQTVTIADARPQPLAILGVDSTSVKIQPRLSPPARDDPRIRQVDLTIAGDFPVGRSEEMLTIRTADERHSELVIPVTVVRSSRIRVLPERLHGRLASAAGQAATWQVLLSDSKGAPVRVESVACREPAVAVRFPTDATTRCRLAVEVAPEVENGVFEAEIVIRIAEPIPTELSLPVRLD